MFLFCSGACALIYQTVWMRDFRLIFGVSTLATGAVLAIFMGGLGVGSALLAAGESWAQARSAHILKVETQNTNVPACRFYASRGFVLRDVRRGAYPELPTEVQLLWYKDLV